MLMPGEEILARNQPDSGQFMGILPKERVFGTVFRGLESGSMGSQWPA